MVRADQLDDIKARGTLVCGVLGTFEPFGFTDPRTRKLTGYDADFCQAIADKLGVKADIRPLSVEARIPELQQKRVDILTAGVGYSPLRAEQIDFSAGYFVSEHKITVKKSRGLSSLKELEGLRVSFTKGGITESFVKHSVPGARLTGYEDTPTAFTALIQNKVAGFSVAEAVAKRLIAKADPEGKQFTVLEPPVGQETWGVGVHKGEPRLLTAVNDALLKTESSGQAQALFDKWLGSDTPYGMKRTFTIKPIGKS